ncbi:AAA family ATPase [Thermithiobacillus plumbiphilus]|uniref:AAA family ATPase n=1 Tax=Thermithiobacillus plumbiphilus TaxID=1729899 RepID=A0ABU9D5N0_9PROT
MRILAIRGRNLASLAGSFELDLANGPLGRAGLFAISGRTGAGKSTLLDALCLALFDRVPRLTQANKVAVGQADLAPELRISGDDVRGILRRGAAEGYAEVDFIGIDRKTYRARWEVRRAKNKPGGRLQEQVLTLRTLPDDHLIGRTKKEILAEISQRLGLSFDQFRRAVLLAQGDFAAFLKAAHKERSELLERITGTEIYSELSRAAYHRAREEEQKLRELELRLQALSVLSDDDRQALLAEKALIAEARDKTQGELAVVQDALRWHEQATSLRQDCDRAVQTLQQAELAWQAAADRVEVLNRVRAAQPLRPLLEACDRAAGAGREAEAARQAALKELAKAEVDLSVQEQAYSTAEGRHQTAASAWDAAQPALQAARELDVRIREAGHQLESAERLHREAGLQAAQAADAASELRARQALQESALDADREWLGRQQHVASLAAQWPRWEDLLKRALQSRQTQLTAEGALPLHQSQLQDFQAGILRLEAELQAALAAEESAEQSLAECEAAASRYSLEAISNQRNTREALRARLQHAAGLLTQAGERWQALSRVQAQRQSLAAELLAAEQALASHQPLRPPLEARLAEAESMLERTLLAAQGDVAQLRAQLQTGEPCMVCGAQEHPWAQHHPAFEALLGDQRARVNTLKAELQTLIETELRWQGKLEQSRQAMADCEQQISDLEQRCQALQAEWASLPERQDELGPVWDAALATRMQARLLAVTAELEQLQGQEKAALASEAALRTARETCESQRRKRERLQADTQARRGREQMLIHALEQESATATAALAEYQSACGQLAEALAGIPNWQTQLASEGMRFLAACCQRVLAYEARAKQAADADAALREIAPKLAEAESLARTLAAQAGEALQGLLQCRQHLAGLEAERRQFFDGAAVESASRQLQVELDQARASLDAARDALAAAREALALARQTLAHRTTQVADAQRQLVAAQAELSAALAGLGWQEVELRQWLSHEASWLARESAALEALQNACRDASVRLEARQSLLARHEQSVPPMSEEDAREALAMLQARLQSHVTDLAGIDARLRQDDQQREQAASTRESAEVQRAHWALWESLRELIGSADGAKFRNFAQSLTLDALLGQANRHLVDLARRYRLERAPGSDLDIQVVDLEMADEVRSVHSLSGGESFLVSLALALGLASLSSQRTQVESLFIDEGFGALDPDTLGIAVGSLDALQSQGRQIGVISHVPALVESIGVQVHVEAMGSGRSRVRVVDAQLSWQADATLGGMDEGGEGDAEDLSRQSA